MSQAERSIASAARRARLRTGLEVAVAVVLAVAAAVLATEVADWRYARWDLSSNGRNTIDPATSERIDNLDGELAIHTFLEPLVAPYDAVSGEALTRVAEMLYLVANASRDKVSVIHHDMSDPAAVLQEQIALGVEGTNVVVLKHGTRKAVIHVFGEGVAIDWGNPGQEMVGYLTERGIPNVVDPRTWNPNRFEPARIVGFPFESVLAAAVARVSIERSLRAYVATGHGESAIEGTTTGGLRLLAAELERDGFRVSNWDAADGAVPDDCDLLFIVGPRQPYGESEIDAVRTFVERGGRLILAPGAQSPAASIPLLDEFGISLANGIVCEEIRVDTGELMEGHPYCAVLKVDGRTMAHDHPVTELLRRNGLRLEFSNTASFERGAPPPGATLRELVRSTREAWRDTVDPISGGYNYALDSARGERKGSATLLMLAELRLSTGSPPGRVLAVGSASFLADGAFRHNRDFHRAMANWMVERENRVDVTPRTMDVTAIDVTRGSENAVFAWSVLLGLPGLCALFGVVIGWRRRRA